MSIINEALKKTEQYIQKNPPQDILPPKSKPRAYLLYILVLISGLFLSHFIFSLLKDKAKPVVLQQKIALQAEKTKISAPALVFAPIPPAPIAEEKKNAVTSFVLNGIFFSDDNSYALINNQIVRENDSVDGAKVKIITEDSVVLDNAGVTIKLHTNR